MSVIHDMTQKAAHWHEPPLIIAEDHADKLICRLCGKQYASRGKWDCGICRECEKEKNAHCIGGPYDGEPAHDKS